MAETWATITKRDFDEADRRKRREEKAKKKGKKRKELWIDN